MLRFYIPAAVVAGLLAWAAIQVPTDRLELRVLRGALFIAAGVFAVLLLLGMLQGLFDG